jgi:hypothetical protein
VKIPLLGALWLLGNAAFFDGAQSFLQTSRGNGGRNALNAGTPAFMVGTWKGYVEKYKHSDGFLGMLEHVEVHLHADGSAGLILRPAGSASEADLKHRKLPWVKGKWRLKGRKLVLFNPADPGDKYTLYLRKDHRTLDDPGNSGNGVVFVLRKL